MRLSIRLLLLLCIASASAFFAQQLAELPSFEVASIKEVAPDSQPTGLSGLPGADSPGQLRITNFLLAEIIQVAFGKKRPWEIVFRSSPTTKRYDITANAPAGVKRDQFPLMLQKLLRDRFGMVAHGEMRELPVYELTLAQGSTRFTPLDPPPVDQAGQSPRPRIVLSALPKDRDGWPVLPPDATGRFLASVPPYNRYMFRALPLSALVEHLGQILDRPVVDKTGLDGIYNYDLEVLRVERLPANASMSQEDRNRAMREADDQLVPNMLAGVVRMGLKVTSTKASVEVVVIDKLNDKPTEN